MSILSGQANLAKVNEDLFVENLFANINRETFLKDATQAEKMSWSKDKSSKSAIHESEQVEQPTWLVNIKQEIEDDSEAAFERIDDVEDEIQPAFERIEQDLDDDDSEQTQEQDSVDTAFLDQIEPASFIDHVRHRELKVEPEFNREIKIEQEDFEEPYEENFGEPLQEDKQSYQEDFGQSYQEDFGEFYQEDFGQRFQENFGQRFQDNFEQAFNENVQQIVDLVKNKSNNNNRLAAHGKWFIDCARCSTTIKWSQRKNHIRKHLAEDNKPKLYSCLLCKNRDRPNESNYLEHMHFHVRKMHNVPRALQDVHFAKSVYFDAVVDEALRDCFHSSVKVFEPAEKGDCPVPKLKLSLIKDRTGEKSSPSYMVKSLDSSRQVEEQRNAVSTEAWRYRCLYCMGAVVFETMYLTSIKKHLEDKHQIIEPAPGKNYMDVNMVTTKSESTIGLQKHQQINNSNNVRRNGCNEYDKNKIVRKYRKQAILSTARSSNWVNLQKNFCLADDKKSAIPMFQTCKACGKNFRNQHINLRMHCRYHLREKGFFDYLYQCTVCKNENKLSTFMQEAHVRSHVKIHHKIECPQNGEHFSNDTEKFRDLIIEEVKQNFDYSIGINSRKHVTGLNSKKFIDLNSRSRNSAKFVDLNSKNFSRKFVDLNSKGAKSQPASNQWQSACNQLQAVCGKSLFVDKSQPPCNKSQSAGSKLQPDCNKSPPGCNNIELASEQTSSMPVFQKCKVCFRSFRNQLTNLRTHSRYHLREQGIFDYLYECLECKREGKLATFMQEAHVRSHVKNHHKISVPKCDLHFTNETEKFRDLITAETKRNFNYYVSLRAKKLNRSSFNDAAPVDLRKRKINRVFTEEQRRKNLSQLSVSRQIKAQYASIRKICETIIPVQNIKVELQS